MEENSKKERHHANEHEHHNAEHHKHEHHTHHHKVHKHQEGFDLWKWATIVLAVILIIFIGNFYFGNGTNKNSPKSSPNQADLKDNNAQLGKALETYKDLIADGAMEGNKDAKIVIVEFSDFQCPFCGRFYSQTYPELKKKYIDTGKVLFVYRHFPLSFHQNSMNAALASECAREQGKFWEYHNKLFENQKSLDKDSLKKYASDLGLDTAKFNSCLDDEKYKSKVEKDFEYGQKKGVSGTPTFFINGKQLVGAVPLSSFEQMMDAIENPGSTFNIYLINDKRCTSCDTQRLESITAQLFPTGNIVKLDVSDPKGKEIIDKLGISLAPALVFDKKVEETSTYKTNDRLKSAFVIKDDYDYIKPEGLGSTWIIDDQKREAAMQKVYDELGLKKGDNKPQVDFFVMSYCPYGNQAEELLKPVYDKLKDKALFIPRYVIYNQGSGCMEDSDGNKYCSLHGAQELHEDIRELCVYNKYGEGKWFDFALAMNDKCTSKNADTCWEDVAKSVGIDVNEVNDCFNKEGIELLKEEYKLNQLLGVRGSPTLFFEGQQYSGARTSDGYLKALCNGFENKPEECNDVLNTKTTTVPSGSCG